MHCDGVGVCMPLADRRVAVRVGVTLRHLLLTALPLLVNSVTVFEALRRKLEEMIASFSVSLSSIALFTPAHDDLLW